MQVVGTMCGLCNAKLSSIIGVLCCEQCEKAFHRTCLGASSCPSCKRPVGDAEGEETRRRARLASQRARADELAGFAIERTARLEQGVVVGIPVLVCAAVFLGLSTEFMSSQG